MILEIDKYKRFLNIISDDYNDIIEDIVDGVEADVESFLKFPLASDTRIEYHSGQNSPLITLDAYEVTEITSIEVWNGDDWEELVQGSDYDRVSIINKCQIYLEGADFESGIENYRITFVSGFVSIPKNILQAIKRLVKIKFDETPFGKNALGVRSLSDSGGISQQIDIDKSESEKIYASLETYARTNV